MDKKDMHKVFYAFVRSGTCLKCREDGKRSEMDITPKDSTNHDRRIMSPFCNKCRAGVQPEEKEALYAAGLTTVEAIEAKIVEDKITAAGIRETWHRRKAAHVILKDTEDSIARLVAKYPEHKWLPPREWPDDITGTTMRVYDEISSEYRTRVDELDREIIRLLNGRAFRVGRYLLIAQGDILQTVEELHG